MNKTTLNELKELAKDITVLYAEDDVNVRESTHIFLKTFFKKIDCAKDGLEAYKKYKNNKYDIIITDIKMPNINGIELIEKIRAIDSLVSIIVISAHSEINYLLSGIKFSIDDYLLKPIDTEEFLIVLSKVLNNIHNKKLESNYKNSLECTVQEKTDELNYNYTHEYYTNLPNLIQLNNDLSMYMNKYMILLDISNFSFINKEYGRDLSNKIIAEIGQVLKLQLKDKSKLYKIESDRFIIILDETSKDELSLFCEKIILFFDNNCIEVDDINLLITFNIGASEVIKNELCESIVCCDYALDKSKSFGSRHFEIYDENSIEYSFEKNTISRLDTARDIVINDNIKLYFQPIKNIYENRVNNYEVLVRGMVNNELLAPDTFLSEVESLGLISLLTRSIIEKSFIFFKDNNYNFSINVTEIDLFEGYLPKYLDKLLKKYSIESNRVTFEVLETVAMNKSNKNRILHTLNSLKDLGFNIAIDDFGIEHSNFSRISSMDFDYIKLDGLFIKGLDKNKKNENIIKTIVNLAKMLNIKVIAEFVENEKIYNIVKDSGIDYAQGQFIGMPKAELL